jgi:hypothetical protein
MKERHKIFMIRVAKVLQWRVDVESGEMIEHVVVLSPREQYCKDHLIIEDNLDPTYLRRICSAANDVFRTSGCNLMVYANKGKVVPGNTDAEGRFI